MHTNLGYEIMVGIQKVFKNHNINNICIINMVKDKKSWVCLVNHTEYNNIDKSIIYWILSVTNIFKSTYIICVTFKAV